MPHGSGMTMREVIDLARTRTKCQFGFDISLPSLKLLATRMAGNSNFTNSFIPGNSTFSIPRPKFFLTVTGTSYITSLRDEFFTTYNAILNWAFMVFTRRKNKVGNLWVFFSMAVLTKQSKVTITIIKMVSVSVMYLKAIVTTAFLAVKVSPLNQSLQGVWIRVVKFILFPVWVIPTDKMFSLVDCLTRFRAKTAANRGVMTNFYSALFTNTYLHNENIAHNAHKCQAVRRELCLIQ